MGNDQEQAIRSAASAAIFKLTSMLSFPALVTLQSIDSAISDLESIKAIAYEHDAMSSHDDCTAIQDIHERKAA